MVREALFAELVSAKDAVSSDTCDSDISDIVSYSGI